MSRFVTGLVLFVSLLFVVPAHADYKGWVTIARGRALYVVFHEPAPGKPIVVLANGLTHDIRYWEKFAQGLEAQGFGVFRWDMMGQLMSLKRYGKPTGEIPYMDQIRDLRDLLVKMNLRAPMHFVGLSYGGMIVSLYTALYPNHVLSCVAMAPFVAPIAAQDTWIRGQIAATRIAFPLNPASDDELYTFFLRQIVYGTYPAAEPSVFDHPYKLEATLWLAFGARKYQFADIADHIPPGKFHMIVAGKDQYLDRSVTDRAWEQLPRGARMSRTIINGVEHKMNEVIPVFSSAMVAEILKHNPAFADGRTLQADPIRGTVSYRNHVVIDGLPHD